MRFACSWRWLASAAVARPGAAIRSGARVSHGRAGRTLAGRLPPRTRGPLVEDDGADLANVAAHLAVAGRVAHTLGALVRRRHGRHRQRRQRRHAHRVRAHARPRRRRHRRPRVTGVGRGDPSIGSGDPFNKHGRGVSLSTSARVLSGLSPSSSSSCYNLRKPKNAAFYLVFALRSVLCEAERASCDLCGPS